jgi:arylsulfatase A-like enzyme
MKRFNTMVLALFASCVGFQAQASVVYEGFAYPAGDSVVGQGSTSNGWAGAWSGSGENIPSVASGLTFDSLSVSGGSAQRASKVGLAEINRQISTASQAALTGDGTTLWFSVLMNAGSGGNAGNTYGTLIFGDTALTSGDGSAAAPIGSGGNAIGVGFAGNGSSYADVQIQGVTYNDGVATQNSAERITVGTTTSLIVGQVDWAANGTTDTVSLYNVSNPSNELPAAFATMEADLDQSAFNVVGIGAGQTSVFDEIRFDTTLAGVISLSATNGGNSETNNGGTSVTNSITPPNLQIAAAHTSLNVAATFPSTNTFPFLLQFSSNLTDNAWSNYDRAFVTNKSWVLPTAPSKGFFRAKKQPNIVFVFADQMRACALGAMGNTEVITPELDRLATEGMMLTQAISSQPVCTPYRAQLLSGRYGHTTGVVHNDIRLGDDELLLPTILKSNGYTTGYIGKWHLAGNRSDPVDETSRRDWDYWAVRNCSHDHDYVRYWENDATTATYVPDAWEPTVQTDLAIDFINQHTNEPFCLMISMGPPHNPYEAPEEYLAMYDNVTITTRPNVPNSSYTNTYLQYYAMITSIDENMGRLDAAIEAAGLEDDTIFIFTADHGDMLGSLGQTLKQRPWEESINIPFIIRYPRGIEGGQQPDWLFSSIDVMPTLLGLCRIDLPDNLQGMDYSSTFTRTSSAERDAVYLFNVQNGAGPGVDWRGIRTKEWTYAYHNGGDWVLYNLANDPYQLNNLVDNAEYAQVKASLADKLETMRIELGDTTELVGDSPSAIVLP